MNQLLRYGKSLFFILNLVLGTLMVNTAHAEITTTYYHTDAAGSVVAASDDTGSLLWRKSYSPYGEKVADGEGDSNAIAFTGKQHDDVTGLTYFGARYYDPEVGRFMGMDAVGFSDDNPISFNRYAYANNNPYRYKDPDGNIVFLIPIVAFVAKEIAGEVFERTTGIPAVFTVKGAAKAGIKLLKTLGKKGVKNVKGTGPCCFVAGTKVLTESGHKNIEDIKLNDLVYSKDVETGEQNWKPVTQLFQKYRLIYELTVATEGGHEELIKTTDDHPFYIPSKGWVTTIDLLPGDAIEAAGLGSVSVKSVISHGEYDTTYNIEVADYHTYYATGLDLLVHNTCDVSGKWMSLSDAGARRASDIKKEASDAFRNATSDAKKQAHSGQGHKKLQAQASALEGFARKNEKNFLPEFMEPIKKEAKRLREKASSDRHN